MTNKCVLIHGYGGVGNNETYSQHDTVEDAKSVIPPLTDDTFNVSTWAIIGYMEYEKKQDDVPFPWRGYKAKFVTVAYFNVPSYKEPAVLEWTDLVFNA